LRSLMQLRPRQAFDKPCRIDLIVDERVRSIIRLPPRTLREHNGNTKLLYWHYSTFRYGLVYLAAPPTEQTDPEVVT